MNLLNSNLQKWKRNQEISTTSVYTDAIKSEIVNDNFSSHFRSK